MTKFKKLFNSALAVALIAGSMGVAGCSGVSEEQMAELEALKQEVKSLEKEVNEMKAEKTKLKREIAEKQAKLDQCAKDKEATKENLKKLGK